ncbi:MAG: hypothetical protein GX616_00990, partial [Planctomycetes bacterium]|nr:hypothetical protein [Planctomycetota bacterium]
MRLAECAFSLKKWDVLEKYSRLVMAYPYLGMEDRVMYAKFYELYNEAGRLFLMAFERDPKKLMSVDIYPSQGDLVRMQANFITRVVFGLVELDKKASEPASAPTTRPAQAPASRDAEEQITKAYDAGESADQLAEKLNKTVPSLFVGENVTIRSSPDAKQILVTGSPRVHALFDSLSAESSELAADWQPVIRIFGLRNRKAASWVEVIQSALDEGSDLVVADAELNCLVVYTAKKSLNRIAYLVAVLDRPVLTGDGKTIDRLATAVRLKHAKAADVVEVITSLYREPVGIPKPATPQAVLAGMVTASSSKGSDNRVLISAPPQLEPEIKALMPLLDTARPADVELSKVFALEHADAEEVAALLASLWKESRTHFRATAHTDTNSLIVQGNIACLQNVTAMLRQLDSTEGLRQGFTKPPRKYIDQHKPGSTSQPATSTQADTASSSLDLAHEEEWREERPWVVEGRVTDEKNQPLAGVEISVRCGVGRLHETGRTLGGPDGRYTLRFAAGTWSNLTPSRWQRARITAHKEGFTVGNEWRDGDLFIAPEPPEGKYVGLPREKMILPNRPYRLDLAMTAVPIDKTAENTPWGKAEEGVQLRI